MSGSESEDFSHLLRNSLNPNRQRHIQTADERYKHGQKHGELLQQQQHEGIISSGDDGLLRQNLMVKEQPKRGRPITNQGRRSTRRREHYRDKKNIDTAAKKLAEKLPGADAEFAKCLQTSAGRQMYPALANPIQGNEKLQTVVKAMAGTLLDLRAVKPVVNVHGLGAAASPVLPVITRNSAVAAPLVAMLFSHAPGLKPAEFAQHLGLNPGYVRTAMFQAKQRAEGSGKPTVLDMKQDNQREGKLTCHILLQEIINDFFVSETCVFSGQSRNLRRLFRTKKELRCRFIASYPQLLREKAAISPELLRPTSHLATRYTKLQASALAAVWAAKQPGFSEQREYDSRRVEVDDAELDERVSRRLARLGIRNKVAKVLPKLQNRSVAGFDASAYTITVPAEETFWAVLEHHKVRFSQVHNPTQCPIHDKGPEQEALMPLIVAELLELAKVGDSKAVARRKELVGQLREVRAQVALYRQHLVQYETQRKKIQQLEEDLKPGEGLIYRDFVNDHDESGAKVCNLQLVLVERKVTDGPLVLVNLANFADKEACDAWFTADVFDFHLSRGDNHHPGLFDHLNKLYICGDHGPHFSANNTILNETTFFRRYGKTLHCVFLCSYHAYNRCDAAGVVPKRLASQLKREGRGALGAEAYAHMVNTSPYSNHVAFFFASINRNASVFAAEATKLPHARQACDLVYHHVTVDGACVREEGVVWFKMVSDSAVAYQLHDLLPREGKYMCEQCSNALQVPLFHVLPADCPRTTMPVNLEKQRAVLVTPDPSRLEGFQMATKNRPRQPKAGQSMRNASSKAAGEFPCKNALCTMLHYRSARGANRHMAKAHKDESLLPYPVPEPIKGSRHKPVCAPNVCSC